MMADEDMIVMSQKESNRLYVIRQTIDKAITQDQAAEMLGLTDRQVRRIARNFKMGGTQAFATSPEGSGHITE
jgi:hypothetical protein